MSLSKTDLIQLAKITANANPSSQVAYSFGEDKFSYRDLNETLRKELQEIAGTYSLYRENKNLIFSLNKPGSFISTLKISILSDCEIKPLTV